MSVKPRIVRSTKKCVVCNASIVHDNHHCDEKTLERIEAGRLAHVDRERDSYPANYGTRLGIGFWLLGDQDYSARRSRAE